MTQPLNAKAGGQPESGPLPVAIGTHVEVELLTEAGSTEQMAFDLVPDAKANLSAGFLGAGTPLAKAILGHPAGACLPYQVADIVQVRIANVAPSTSLPPDNVEASRQAILNEAVSKSNLADTLQLALTVDVKWGDYDPEGIEKNWDG